VQPRKIVRYLGLVVGFLGLFMATSLPWALAEREARPGGLQSWLLAVFITLGLGGASFLYGRSGTVKRRSHRAVGAHHDVELNRREALVIVSVSWILCGVFAALPLLLDGMVSHPVDAFFEATSGFTTTGSTILTDIESNSRASLWWRSLIQWLGGMGIIVLFVALFPQIGAGGRRLFEGEAPGPTKDQLRPRVRETGLVLWRIYAGFTAALGGLLMAQGMSFFDAACHAFTTMATGGFSTKNASIAGFESASIEWTITLFMLFAGVNFGLYYALRRGRGLRSFRDPELYTYIAIVLFSTAAITWVLLPAYDYKPLEALRYGAFQVAAIVTSTGYGTADFNVWPEFARTGLLMLMFVGGMGGSTAGGFKVSRAIILFSAAVGEVRHVLHPRAVFSTRLGSRAVEDRVVRQVLALFVIAVFLLFGSTVALSMMGIPFETAFSAAMTCQFNSGPGLNELGPAGNFSGLPDAAKLLLSGLMILGRLEFYTVLALLAPGFWRSR
jgi:trk system potassium uptake protein